jgi:peptidase M49-like protein
MGHWSGWTWAAALGVSVMACQTRSSTGSASLSSDSTAPSPVTAKLAQYTPVRLTAELGGLSDKERRMIPLLIEAAQAMDTIFWREVYPSRDSLLQSLGDVDARRYVLLNYGPWDRLDGNRAFVTGVGERPPGAEFYPHDMAKADFETAAAKSTSAAASLRSHYTVVRRGSSGDLIAIPYHQAYANPVRQAAAKIREAVVLAEDPGLRRYLELRARALETDDYQASDLAWLDMKHNTVDVVIGPIETYDDALFGYKAAHEAYVLIKDKDWSARLARYARRLPELQRGLPVPAAYKRETPGTDSDLNAYEVVYYAGEANAGGKTIAINLPNDEQVQLKKGTRRLQLKNAMRAKFDRILRPIAHELIVEQQQANITFDAFFSNVMFHEVAHGLGIKHTIAGKGTVRDALKEQAGALEEGKADVLGLHLVTRLVEQGELKGISLDDSYVTFLASIFRSVRFGASDAHGRANAAQFSYFQEHGGFSRDPATGRFRVDVPKMRAATDSLAAQLLRFQGDGDYEEVQRFMQSRAVVPDDLRSELDRLATKGIPVDVTFEQGLEVLGLGR